MNIKSIILADDQGENMKSSKDKVLHSILGKTLIDYCVDVSKQVGVNQICVIGTGQCAAVQEVIGHKVQHFFEIKEQGMEKVAAFIGDCGDVVILNGDAPLITSVTIKKAIEVHRKADKAVTILSRPLEVSQGRDLIHSEEAAGKLYVFKAKVLKSALLTLSADSLSENHNFEKVVARLIEEGYKVEDMAPEHVLDLLRIKSRKQLAQCTSIMKDRINEKHMENGVTIQDPLNTYIEIDVSIGYDTIIEPNCMLRGDTVIGDNCFIGHNSNIDRTQVFNGVKIENSEIQESIIGENSHIGPFSYIRPQSVIGKHVRIGDFVEIKNSTIGDYTKASHLTYVGDADVGKHVNFGCGSILVNYDGVNKHRSTIGDYAFIGCNTKIISPVNIGKRAYTAAGSTITHDVPEESLGIARARQKNMEGWVAHKFPEK